MNVSIEFNIGQFGHGSDLPEQYAEELYDAMIAEKHEVRLANLFSAWDKKGITENEIYAMAKIMRDRCTKIESKHERFVDVVGTGGSKAKTFNVSTAAAFVIAGAGVPIAKHGNRAATSNSGSADVLSALGIEPAVEPVIAEKCLNDIGICFMFAPNFHRLSPTLAKVRRGLGYPTIFNNLGPLCNPANAPFQLIGVWDSDLVEKTANVLARLGTRSSWVVHGSDGLDELTLNGVTHVAEAADGHVRTFDLDSAKFGARSGGIEHLRVSSASESAALIRSILNGTCTDRAAIDLVLLNAAAPIFIAGYAETRSDAYQIAKESLTTGAASDKLSQLAAATNK